MEKDQNNKQEILQEQVLSILKKKIFQSRKTIVQKLKCDVKMLTRVLADLKDEGRVEAQRGRSGGFRLFEEARILESDYYPILQRSLDKWFEVEGGDAVVVYTAYSGRTNTGGRWTRPDFYVVHKVKYEYFHHVIVEYIAIEVKNWDNKSSVTDVYEVLNHRTRATGALLIYVGPIEDARETGQFQAIERTCAQHGIGLVFVSITLDEIKSDASSLQAERFYEQVEWVAVTPSPKDISEFIDVQFDDESKKQYGKLVGSVPQ